MLNDSFLFLFQKALFLLGPRLGRVSRVVTKLPRGLREGQVEVLRLAGAEQRREPHGRWSLLVMLESEPLKEMVYAQRRLGYASLHWLWPSQPMEVVRWLPIFLMSFTSSFRKWFSRKSQRWCSMPAEPREWRPKGAWFKFFSRVKAASMASWVLAHSFWDGLCTSWKSARPCQLSATWALTPLFGQFTEAVYTLQIHIIPIKIVARVTSSRSK